MAIARIFKEEKLDFICDLEAAISKMHVLSSDDILEQETGMSPTHAPAS